MVPAAIDWFAGVTAIDDRAAGVTVSVVAPLTAPTVAVIVLPPTPVPVASPPPEMLATGVDELQPADAVRFWVVPSL